MRKVESAEGQLKEAKRRGVGSATSARGWQRRRRGGGAARLYTPAEPTDAQRAMSHARPTCTGVMRVSGACALCQPVERAPFGVDALTPWRSSCSQITCRRLMSASKGTSTRLHATVARHCRHLSLGLHFVLLLLLLPSFLVVRTHPRPFFLAVSAMLLPHQMSRDC